MAEPIRDWWARRQFSRGVDVPYPVGTYREAWAPFPVLIRQYHPDLNAGIVLTQIPPAADVLLQWQCDAGHVFVATPEEQRSRPGRERRRSSWCPECVAAAKPKPVLPVGAWAAAGVPLPRTRPPKPTGGVELCTRTPDLPVGEPFTSVCAPKPASSVEAQLRAELGERLDYTTGFNAVRVRRPFFDHLEVWPDILLPELRIAVEYDSTGRHGLEHVGRREEVDRRKDRTLRAAGWEVVRIRTGRLEKLGPHDLQLAGLGKSAYAAILDEFRTIRGPFLVDAYLR
ncbi:zinc-ribbon domain-containing protein [Naasia sp. SYSU D00057]|uniref:zinc-ribbon domain-containing protein n=1 Tax=Naasia sp. SYSU D00057 TaxID=2817380 RepID=UPI001B302B51|nr:zinc-ribbon domain-containing protein [Naasia sp. SYSU D00057]